MLSSSFDISEFIRKVEGHSDREIVFLADQEAIAAERYLFRCRECRDTEQNSEECASVRQYALLLKDVVLYIRHGVITRLVRELDVILPGSFERRYL
jgi:hypothetical protein